MKVYVSQSNCKCRHARGGFTLIELMVVVVIVAILAAVAYPSYQQYVRESKRADAHSALTRIAQLQEKFFSDNNTYAVSVTSLGYAATPTPSPDGYWQVSTASADPTVDYTLTAAPRGSHTDPQCTTITLNSAGLRSSTPAGGNCW